MLNRRSKGLLQVANVKSVASRNEGVTGSDGHGDGVYSLNDSGRGHGFRLDPLGESGRCLTLRQSIDSVIIKDVCEIQIPPTRVNEVSSSYAKPVSITTHGDTGQSGITRPTRSSNCQHPAVQR